MDLKSFSVVVFILIILAVVFGMYATDFRDKVKSDTSPNPSWTSHGMCCMTRAVEVEGHRYIILDGMRGNGIVHAASCPCMSK